MCGSVTSEEENCVLAVLSDEATTAFLSLRNQKRELLNFVTLSPATCLLKGREEMIEKNPLSRILIVNGVWEKEPKKFFLN